MESLTINRILLMADVAEWTRLMECNEEGTIQLWRDHLLWARREFNDSGQCRWLWQAGDAILLACQSAEIAVKIAFNLHDRISQSPCVPYRTGEQITGFKLRIGLHQGALIEHPESVYGHSINLLSRVTSMAEPGQTLCTKLMRNRLVELADTQIHDLGWHQLKHLQSPIRIFSLLPS